MSNPRTKKKKDKGKPKATPKPKRKPASNAAPERERVHPAKGFTEEAKREAVALLERGDISVDQLANDLGIADTSLRSWQREFAAEEENTPMTREERREMTRLRRELERVTMERDILKKAATFFAKRRP